MKRGRLFAYHAFSTSANLENFGDICHTQFRYKRQDGAFNTVHDEVRVYNGMEMVRRKRQGHGCRAQVGKCEMLRANEYLRYGLQADACDRVQVDVCDGLNVCNVLNVYDAVKVDSCDGVKGDAGDWLRGDVFNGLNVCDAAKVDVDDGLKVDVCDGLNGDVCNGVCKGSQVDACIAADGEKNREWKILRAKENPKSPKQMDSCVARVGEMRAWETSSLDEILNSLEEMPALPSVENMVFIMQKCTKEKNLTHAKRLHALIHNCGSDGHVALGNHLVQMLVACKGLRDAQHVFDRLLHRKEYAWTSLIQGYIENGDPHQTLNLFDKMHEDLVRPAMYTFPAVLKACAKLKRLDKGRQIHAEIITKGLELDLFVGNSLVDMYAKCGSLAEAQEVFKQRRVRNVVSWNALITAYAEHGRGEEVLTCLEQMQLEGLSPDTATFICSLKACGSIRAITKSRGLHNEIVKQGWENVSLIGNTLVDMYAKCGSLREAQKVFEQLPIQTVVSWTALIAGYAEHGPAAEALNCFKQMQREGLYPDDIAFVCSLKACGSIGALGRGQEIHAKVVRAGLEGDFLIGNILVDMYAKCGLVGEAHKVFDELLVQNVVSWTALIAGYAEHGHGHKALKFLEEMQVAGVSPNAATYTCSLKACGSIGAIDRGREIHAEIVGDQHLLLGNNPVDIYIERVRKLPNRDGGLEATEEKLAGSLVDMYSRCGCMFDAQKVFDTMPIIDLVTCNALVMGYARQGESKLVVHLFNRMRKEAIEPDGVTLLGVLTACSHAGFVSKAHKYFEVMSIEYTIAMTLEHYNCMIDLFGRAGQLDEAIAMLESMPFQPNLVTWGSMLSACRNGNNVELGRQTLECAAAFDKNLAPTLISMSNIYATAHMWEDVEIIKAIIQSWKDP